MTPQSAQAPARATDAAGPTPGASLTLAGLKKRYADQYAVDDVSLDIQPGEFVTFLGPSGSGKTTTLNMIAGFATVDEGQVLLDGRSIADLPAHKRDIGMVFQNYALFPHMSAFENVAFPLKQRKIPKAEIKRRAMAALEMAHMDKYAHRLPSQLSGGQQQRVAVARAIVFNPRILLMDEPLGALDKKLRETLQLEIRRIHRELGITFIYVTHDQEEALVLSDRIAVFNEGKIVQVGTSVDLYERPLSGFVADFLGESNIIDGSLSQRDGRHWLQSDGLQLEVEVPADWSAGDSVRLAVRPESVRLATGAQAAAPECNSAPATVEEVIYLGNCERYLLRLQPSGHRFAARSHDPRGAQGFEVGDSVVATWPVKAGVILPGS